MRTYQTSTIRLAALALAALVAAAAAVAGADQPSLDRPVRLTLWGGTLTDFAREAQKQTGVEILFFSPDFPPEQTKPPICLISGGASLRAVLECLARRFSFRYRLAQPGKVEISKGYDWIGTDFAVRFPRLDELIPTNRNQAELHELLAEYVKPLPLLGGDYSFVLEQSPAPGGGVSIKGLAVLPPVMADYLEKAIKCLAGDPGYRAGAKTPPAQFSPEAFSPDLSWEAILARQAVRPPNGSLQAILRAACDETRTAVLLDMPSGKTDDVSLDGLGGGHIGIGRLTEELALRLKLGKRVLLAAGAVVFEAGSSGELEVDARSREYFWAGLAVAGFDARAAAERAGSGRALVALLRGMVYPGVWRDPMCAVNYSPVTGRLAVVAPANVVAAMESALGTAEAPPAAKRAGTAFF